MDIKAIKELIALTESSEIDEIEIEDNGYRVRICKNRHNLSPVTKGAVRNTTVKTKKTSERETEKAESEAKAPLPAGEPVLSPMLGVFYAAPSPQSEPFVKVGDKVRKGDTLCIIEAMKLMNEIAAERDGEIVEILASNGQIVEFEQIIFRIA